MTSIRVQGHHALFSAPTASLPIPAAGVAIARFAMAIAPHAETIWLPSDPYSVAHYLQQAGKHVVTEGIPDFYDVCIDCGNVEGAIIEYINARPAPVLAVNAPSGLCADTGVAQTPCIRADYTLALGTLSVGLFTGDGRAMAGEVWLDTLNLPPPSGAQGACAAINQPPPLPHRAHNTHKGSFGDVGIIGGAAGMSGAALLAGTAALHGGAGRVFVGLLDTDQSAVLLAAQPELMARHPHDILAMASHHAITIVAGCGGGESVTALLPSILENTKKLVLDADALNAIARDPVLQQLVHSRPPHSTVLTPHPLEAARLLGIGVAGVQSNRLAAAQTLANRFACVVVLKGSGSVIAAPEMLPRINPTGNARLAAAGTGDVLAGLLGAYWATGLDAWDAACAAVFRHGEVADGWHKSHTESHTHTLTARDLALRLGF